MKRPVSRIVAIACMLVFCLALGLLTGCSGAPDTSGSEAAEQEATHEAEADVADVDVQTSGTVQLFEPADGSAKTRIRVASGSENKEAARAIEYAVGKTGVALEMHYMGSLDIMDVLEAGGEDYDAVWPASSMWITMGDTHHIVRDAQSTSTTPVVFGIAKSKAIELGWADEDGETTSPTTAEILAAVQEGKLTFAMTSATQSNSGASAYLAFLTALSGTDGPLTAEDLANGQLTGQVASLLSGVDRSSGSSDWLKEMVVADPDTHQAMVNYESLVSQANRELEEAGHEPMVVVYPADGIAVSDSPLAYVDHGQGEQVEAAFSAIQQALADDTATLELERVGRRCGLGGKVVHADDDEVAAAFNPAWGIVPDASVLKSIPLPAGEVISQALTLYQTGPTLAAEALIQPNEGDVNVLIPFTHVVDSPITANGSDTAALLDYARSREAIGGTDMYSGLSTALDLARQAVADGGYTVAIVLMTDGQSDTYACDEFVSAYEQAGVDVPIFSIMFGEADPTQLDELTTLTNGRTFDGREGDLADVFRQVRGYN